MSDLKPNFDTVEHLYETFLLRASDSKSSLDVFIKAGEALESYRTSHPAEYEIAQHWFEHREKDRSKKRGRRAST